MKEEIKITCPHCCGELTEKFIISESARINGKKSKRKLSSEEASRMSKLRNKNK